MTFDDEALKRDISQAGLKIWTQFQAFEEKYGSSNSELELLKAFVFAQLGGMMLILEKVVDGK